MITLFRNAFIAMSLGAVSMSYASAEIAVIVNPKNAATRMFTEQAAQFFVGKSALFKPIEQADGSAIREEFYRKVLGKDNDQMKAIWSKIVFTGQGLAPKQFSSSANVKKAVAADVNAIGYIDKAEVDDSVKAILTIP
jgi:ABC-type phosphate transport system substrate-binding protein